MAPSCTALHSSLFPSYHRRILEYVEATEKTKKQTTRTRIIMSPSGMWRSSFVEVRELIETRDGAALAEFGASGLSVPVNVNI
ncbi:hypothetical protein RRG08_050976 [Elysia crispata]|uniref:Uncharacterized protein n=1 Tax=Elysia crispata TaxID=231223 RepID=A0AAE0ZZ02_9GAST|nr:hypothetical protein RRG08_050976 [Elysia crispata]